MPSCDTVVILTLIISPVLKVGYIANIWVKDAYNQMRVAIPDACRSSVPCDLESHETILNNEIKNRGYSDKGLVAINASAMMGYTSNTYNEDKAHPGYVYYYLKKWYGTPASAIQYNYDYKNNKVVAIRDPYKSQSIFDLTYDDKEGKSRYYVDKFWSRPVYGLKSDGWLKSYTFKKHSKGLAANQKIRDQILSDGVKYTFSWRPVLIENGVKPTLDEVEGARRTAVCQIDKNNFVFASITEHMTFRKLQEYMDGLGCYTAFNNDGGGSLALWYKTSTDSKVKSKVTTPRKTGDVLYFVEQ